MKYWTLIILVVLSSCKLTRQQRTDNRVVKNLEKIKAKHPDSFKKATEEVIRIDTLLPEIDISGHVDVGTDNEMVDSLAAELQRVMVENDSLKGDLRDPIKETINKYIPKLITIESLNLDTLGIKASIWYDKNSRRLSYSIYKNEQHIVAEKKVKTLTITKTEVINKVPWWVWVIVIALSLITVMALLRK